MKQLQKPRFRLLILCCLMLLSGCAGTSASPSYSSSPTAATATTSIPTATEIQTTTAATPVYGYSFSQNTQGWYQAEQASGKAVSCTVGMQNGKPALIVNTVLSGGTEIDTHTRVQVDMFFSPPQGYPARSHDWDKKDITLQIFLPNELKGKTKLIFVVSDSGWKNDRHVVEDPFLDTGKWVSISMTVNDPQDASTIDGQFDPHEIRAIEVWVEVTDASLNFKGVFAIAEVHVPPAE